MKIWHISQTTITGYDTYSDAVVIAESYEDAQLMHPNGRELLDSNCTENSERCDWPMYKGDISVKCLGEAAKTEPYRRVVCSSFHAG